MPRKRMLDPSIFTDPHVARLSIPARFLWIGLICNADDEGRGSADPYTVKASLLPCDDDLTVADVAKLLDEINETLRGIRVYTVADRAYYCLLNWRRYQVLNRPTGSKLPAPPPKNEYSMSPHTPLSEDSSRRKEGKEVRKKEEKGKRRKGSEDSVSTHAQEQALPTNDNIKALLEDPGEKEDWLSIVTARYAVEDGASDAPFPKFRSSVENSAPSWERLYANYGRDGLEIGVCVYFSETSKSDFERGKRSIDNCLTDLWGRFGGALARELRYKEDEAERSESNKPKPPPISGDPELDEIWNQVCDILRTKIGEEDFNTWFDRVYLLEEVRGAYVIAVPSGYRRDTVRDTYQDSIFKALQRVTGQQGISIEWEVKGDMEGSE